MTTLIQIEEATARLCSAESVLDAELGTLQADIMAAYRKRAKLLKVMIARVATERNSLTVLIDGSRGLFEKPKTQTYFGYKVGLRKGTGSIEFEDEEQVLKLIKKHLPDRADELIKSSEKLMRAGLKELDLGDAKRIGVTIEDTGDVVLIKRTESEVEKALKALLKTATAEVEDL